MSVYFLFLNDSQVTNLRSCVSFSLDFASAETLDYTTKTANELKKLPVNSPRRVDQIAVESTVFLTYKRLSDAVSSATDEMKDQ